jgi:hypothetical protein
VKKVLATIALGVASLGLVAPSAAAQSPSDREIAKAGVFQANDFPEGWRATPQKKIKNEVTADNCPVVKKVGGQRKQRTARTEGETFERRNERYESITDVYRSEDAARRVYGAFGRTLCAGGTCAKSRTR